jgi:hypothetical protein
VSTTHAPARTLTPALPNRPRSASSQGDELRAFGFLLASAGLVLGLLALMYQPLLLGSAGITLGLAAKHAGVGLGRVAVAVAMTGTVLGPTFGSVVHALLVGG